MYTTACTQVSSNGLIYLKVKINVQILSRRHFPGFWIKAVLESFNKIENRKVKIDSDAFWKSFRKLISDAYREYIHSGHCEQIIVIVLLDSRITTFSTEEKILYEIFHWDVCFEWAYMYRNLQTINRLWLRRIADWLEVIGSFWAYAPSSCLCIFSFSAIHL